MSESGEKQENYTLKNTVFIEFLRLLQMDIIQIERSVADGIMVYRRTYEKCSIFYKG